MKVGERVEIPNSIFANMPGNLSEEVFQTLLETDRLRIERIVSSGHKTPEGQWFDQETHEWILVVKGAARLQFESEPGEIAMPTGSYITIPAHKRHRVGWTDPSQETIWLAVHFQTEP